MLDNQGLKVIYVLDENNTYGAEYNMTYNLLLLPHNTSFELCTKASAP
tara:strand:+ start:122 stop:265 length:144 start_codon:yes stop_codon:yes gene_type:complete